MTITRMLPAVCASVASLCVLTGPEPVAAASSPPLAAGVQPASDFTPTHAAYVVTNSTPLYRSPAYGSDNTTGDTLVRGARPQVLGEANASLYLLVGRAGQGVGYAPRSLLCPVDLCPDVREAPPTPK
ncbi:MAG TPA: hypothetical protein VFW13_08125 [Phenylobacterium sp.]|nr:hypothetical protein [Phenylobacterium sp.]